MRDHLGNNRVVFTTKPKTHEFTLNYESSESLPDDEALFEELGNIVPANIHDHTDAGSAYDKSQLLNGATGGVVGSVLTIPVGVGDKINASVYAKYLAPTGTTNPTAAVGSLLAAALTGNTGTLNYEGSITSSYGTSGSMVTNMYGDDLSDTEPKAFINLMFLSDDITETPVIAYNQIKSASGNAHAQLALPEEFVAPSAGYIVVYLSNESDKLTEVYFDDLVVTVNEHPVIQIDSYFPFGMQMAGGYQRMTAKENRFLYNDGSELQKDLDLGVYQTHFRMLDPTIGRWWQVDPKADSLEAWTPYNSMFNNPIRYNDPLGDCPPDDPNCGGRSSRGNPLGAALQKNVTSNLKSANNSANNVLSVRVGAQAAGLGAELKVGKALNIGATGRAFAIDAEVGTNGSNELSTSMVNTEANINILGLQVVDFNQDDMKGTLSITENGAVGDLQLRDYSTESTNQFSLGVTLGQVSGEISANLEAAGDFIESTVNAVKNYFINLIGPIE